MLQKFEKVLTAVLIFLIPTQLALHLWPSWAFVFGIRVDYLAPTIYLTDILVFILLVLNFKNLLKFKKYIFWLAMFAFVNIYFSTLPFVSLFKWLKVFEYILFAISISSKKINLNILYYSAIFFSLIGILQFLLGHTIGGLLYWLGERSFNLSTPGIALVKISGQDFLRAYSTFPHPNALAGYLGICLLLLKDEKKKFGLLIIAICFLLTFSLTAFLAVIAVIVLRKYSSKLFVPVVAASLLMPIVSQQLLLTANFSKNILERLDLAIISGNLIAQHFWLGSGLNTFVVNSSSWLLQPVHNIFLLALSEVGIFGLLLLVFFLQKTVKIFPMVFMFVILTGFFDHYWLDAQQNLLLLSLISGTLYQWKKRV